MKKWIVGCIAICSFLSLNAQTKITKTGVVGKWAIVAVDIPGTFYYNIDKDSLAIGEKMKGQVSEEQLKAVSAAIKQQMGMFIKMLFTFNADGTAILGGGPEGDEDVTYTVDEENSTITTTDKAKKSDTLKAEMQQDQLCITLPQDQGGIRMILKKSK
jgi:hypothetical protein